MNVSSQRNQSASPARLVGTFLFTDIEGSTRLWESHPDRMQSALVEHDTILRRVITECHGEVFKTIGDAFCCFFPDGSDAIGAAVRIQRELAMCDWGPLKELRTRIAIYSGAAVARESDYFGPALNRAARVLAAAHGGQILVSQSVHEGVVSLPPGITLRELGEHRLRDVQQPEYLYQVTHPDLPSEFPPLRTLTTAPDHLPKPVSSFVGREREVAEIGRLLSKTRLLTLIGAGGTGKTRLAIETARRARSEYADGAWFVDLSQLVDPELVPQAAATALGLPLTPNQSIVDTLRDHLRDRSILLAVDNCEHLIEAAAAFVQEMLSTAAGLTIVATSRQALGVPGERTFRVPSLEVPPHGERALTKLRKCDSVRLFVERAALVQPGFSLTEATAEPIAKICEGLDGIPLAIELAAARVGTMPVDRVAERLDQRFRLLSQAARGVVPRHQTLRAMIDWSYGLLTDPERLLLRRVAVFAGGFTVEAAEAVCACDQIEVEEVLDLLAALVEKSLVMYDEPTGRYRLQATVRAYARELLTASAEEVVYRLRHLTYMAEFAERAEPHLLSSTAKTWLEALDVERENFRTSLDWALQAGEIDLGMRLAVALVRFFQGRGYIVEGRSAYSRLLASPGGTSDLLRAKGLRAASVMARSQGDLEAAIDLGRQSLDLFEAAGDLDGAAAAMQALGIASWNLGRIQESRDFTLRSLELRRQQQNLPLVATCLNNLGGVMFQLKDYEAAAAYYSESLDINRRLENRVSIAYNLGNLAELSLARGEPVRALREAVESFGILHELGDRPALAQLLVTTAATLVRLGRSELAAHLFGAQRALSDELKIATPEVERAELERVLGECRDRLGNVAFTLAFEEGRKLRLPQIELLLNGGA
jgi:predicted ATPase/class 3 adenylate cyclase